MQEVVEQGRRWLNIQNKGMYVWSSLSTFSVNIGDLGGKINSETVAKNKVRGKSARLLLTCVHLRMIIDNDIAKYSISVTLRVVHIVSVELMGRNTSCCVRSCSAECCPDIRTRWSNEKSG